MSTTPRPSNRSEQLRQRRAERTHQRTSTAYKKTAPAARERNGPPIVMRNATIGLEARRSSRKRPIRRRLDLALGITGAEMSVRGLPELTLGWRLVSGLLVVVLLIALYTMWYSPLYKVDALEVSGLVRLTPEDLGAASDIIGKPVFVVSPPELEERLLAAFPELAELSVAVSIPGNVVLNVVERQPVIAWQQGEKITWVDENGIGFPARGEASGMVLVQAENPPPGLVVEEGELLPSNGVFLTKDLVSAILVVGKQAPENTPVVYTTTHGLGWQDRRGWMAYFGTDVSQIEMKLNVYKTILKKLVKQNIQPALISVEYVHAPYYRLEP